VAAYYFDTSALVKRYAAETGTIWVRSVNSPGASHILFVALISRAEVVVAIAKRARVGSLSSTDARQVLSDFQNHFQAQYGVIALTREIVERAMTLAPRRSLRGYDAVRLATALTLNDELIGSSSGAIAFVYADTDLNNAAAQEGLAVEDLHAHPDPRYLAP
jgi:predicted nucleic acid-binding protein